MLDFPTSNYIIKKVYFCIVKLKKKTMLKSIKDLNLFIQAAMMFGINYIFIDKVMITNETIAELKQHGYSVMVGQGEAARIKISW